jgi:DNA repair exonuclease SbcCD ATPase subunit
MTFRRAESVFGAPEPQWLAPSDAPISGVTESPISDSADDPKVIPADEAAEPEGDVRWVNTELHAIASTIEELQSRLQEANDRLSSAEKVETTEVEIGRLFVEAQRFVEAYVSKVELKIHEVMNEAEAKAMQILGEAMEEAQEIRREAQQAAFASTRSVQELQSAIAGFTSVNAELLKELGDLNSMLSPGSNPGTTRLDTSSPPGLNSTEAG